MDGMELDYRPVGTDTTIWDVFNSDFVPKHYPVVCLVDGTPVLRKDWGMIITPERQPVFFTIPRGGQGGFKNIIRVVALLAIAIAAPYAGAALAGVVGVTSAAGIAAITAGVVAAGSFLLNAILPAATPKQPGTTQETSPTYSTNAQGNRARLFEPIPKVYGRTIMYPDWVMTPFASYVNNQQQIYQLLCCGLGEYDIESVNIGETEVWNSTTGYTNAITGIEIAIIPPGQPVTLVPGLVYTSPLVASQEMRKVHSDGKYTFTSTRATGATGAGFDGADILFQGFLAGDIVVVTGGPNAGTYTVTATSGGSTVNWIEVSPNFPSPGTQSGVSFDVNATLGPFPASPSGTVTNKIVFDIIWPKGLGIANDDGGLDENNLSWDLSYQLIDNSGTPVGGVTTVHLSRSTANAASLRNSYEYDVPVGRYQAFARRTSTYHGDTKYLDTMQWGGLRGFIPDDNIYADVTLLAVKFSVGEQLTSAATKQINVIETAKIPVYSAGAWQPPVATRSIAWAAADVLRNSVYGAGVANNFVDAAALVTLDATWAARGDTFDFSFDSKSSIWDALSQVLRVGRGFPLLIGSTVSFARDEVKLLNTAVITPRTMMKESFSTKHILFDENSPDDVIIEYMDEETWKNDEVQCKLAGSTSEAPARVKLAGCVNRERAWRYGMYQAASNRYRRVIGNAKVELAGRLLLRGRAVLVSHDLPSWGMAGDVLERLSETELLLSEPVDWSSPLQYFMGLRTPTGGEWGPVLVSQGATADIALMDSTSLASVEGVFGPIEDTLILDDDDRGREPTKFVIGAGETTYARRFLVSSTRPNKMESVDIVLQNYDERVYTAEDDGTVPDRTTPNGPGQIPSKPVVAGLLVSQNPSALGDVVTLFASWVPAAGADSYVAELSYDNANWVQLYSGASAQFQYQATAGLSYLRVAGVGRFRGDFQVVFGVYGSPTSAPGSVPGVDANILGDGSITVTWGNASRATAYMARIYIETTPGSGTYDILKLTRSAISTLAATFGSTEVTTAGGPWNRVLVAVYGVNTVGTGTPGSDTVAVGAPPAPTITTAGPAYTTDTTPLIQGKGIIGATVTLYDGATPRQTVAVDFLGNWSTAMPTLTSAIHTITARQTTSSGTSVASAALVLGINYPGMPAISTVSASTYDSTPTIVGTAIAGSTVRLYSGGVFSASVVADGSGNWSKALAVQSVGAHNITASQVVSGVEGPQTGTPVVITILALDSDTATYIAAMTVEPTSVLMGLLNDLVTSLKSGGIWAKLDALYLLGIHDAQAARLNMKAPATFTLTATSSPTFTASAGYKGTGLGSTAGGYLASTFNPSTAGGQWTQNSAHLGVYVRTACSSTASAQAAEIGVSSGPAAYIFTKHATAGNISTALDDATISSTAGGTPNGLGHFCTSRTASTGYAKYHDGVAQAASAVASTGLPTAAVSILRATTATYSDAELCAAHWGSGLTATEAANLRTYLHTYLAAIGAVA